jgi:drug/metabolite transporter (DMT)-like permease
MFIYLTIAWVGPIYLALFTTTRKIFSVMASIVVHGHSVDNWRLSGITVVSFGILMEAVVSIRGKLQKSKNQDAQKVKTN